MSQPIRILPLTALDLPGWQGGTSGQGITHWQATPLTIRIDPGSTRPDSTGATLLRVELRDSATDTAAPLAATDIENPTGAGPFDLALTAGQLNQPLNGAETRCLWLVIFAVWPDDSLDIWRCDRLTLRDSGASLTAPAPPNPAVALTKSQADALYASLASLAALDARVTTLEEGGGGGGVSAGYVTTAIGLGLLPLLTVAPAADPTTDMRATIQAAIDAAHSNYLAAGVPQYVRLGSGTYRITTVQDTGSPGVRAAGAYGLEIREGVRILAPGANLEGHAGGAFGVGWVIGPYGMRTTTTDFGAASNVQVIGLRITTSGQDESSGNLASLYFCRDWQFVDCIFGGCLFHGVEIGPSAGIQFHRCTWEGPHTFGISGSWVQFDNGSAGARSLVPTARLIDDVLFSACSFSRPDTDLSPHGIEFFHSATLDISNVRFTDSCYFRGSAKSYSEIIGIGAGGSPLSAGQYLRGMTIENCDIEMRAPTAQFITGLQNAGMEMHGIRILHNRFRGNSGALIWLGASSSASVSSRHWDRTGLEIRGNRYDFSPTDWPLGLDFNFFVHIGWQSLAFTDNTIRCTGDLPAGAGQNYSSGVKLFSNRELEVSGNRLTWEGRPPIVAKTLLWIDNQLTDAAGTGYLVNGALSIGATSIAVDSGAGAILTGGTIRIGSYRYQVTSYSAASASAGTITIASPGLTEAVADNAPVDCGATRKWVVEDNAALNLGTTPWSYGILTQRGATAVAGCVSRSGNNIGYGASTNVLQTGYTGDLQADLTLLAPKASPTFTGTVTVPNAAFTLTKLAQSGATTGQAITWNGTAWVATTLAGGGNALTTNPLSQFAATTSAQLAGVISDETGTGALVFANGATMANLTVTGTLSVPDGVLTIAKVSGLQAALDARVSDGTTGDIQTADGAGGFVGIGYVGTGSVVKQASPPLTGTPTAPTATSGTNTTQLATTAFVQTAIAGLINSAPGALDTLDELAAALGDDANFASTVTTALAGKAANGAWTGTGITGTASRVAGFDGAGAAAYYVIGTGAGQVAAGDHTHTGLSVQAAGTPSVRALGTSSTEAAAGNDSRLSDQRTPSNGSVTGAKMAQDGATTGQAWVWNGTAWAPATISGGGGLSNFTEALESTYNSSINVVSLAPASGTNVAVAIVPLGNGYFALSVPDGTSAGGNVRGWQSVDLQVYRASADQVSSGKWSVVLGARNKATGQSSVGIGYNNTVSGFSSALAIGLDNVSSNTNSLTFGQTCTASAYISLAMGRQAVASRPGQMAWSAGPFSVAGDNQISSFHLSTKTTDATATEMTVRTVFSANDRITIAADTVLSGLLTVQGVRSDGSAVASYLRKIAIKRVGATTTLVSSSTVGTDDAAGTAISVTADDTNDRLAVLVTGIASQTWRWTARLDAVETTIGT